MERDLTLISAFLLISLVCWFVNFIYNSVPNKKLERLFAELYSDKAIVQSICQIREDRIWGRGVAQIIEDTLTVQDVRGNRIEVPMKDVLATREYLSLGKIGWFGKRVFAIKSPHTTYFRLGVTPLEAYIWRKALNIDR